MLKINAEEEQSVRHAKFESDFKSFYLNLGLQNFTCFDTSIYVSDDSTMSSVFSSAGHTPQKMRQLYTSELLDIYCSQCCKKVNLLNDLEARLRNLKANR